jgi:hypothetical protein
MAALMSPEMAAVVHARQARDQWRSQEGDPSMKPRINGPVCPNCQRPLLVTSAGTCLCCGRKV